MTHAYGKVHLCADTIDELSTAAIDLLDQVNDGGEFGVSAIQARGTSQLEDGIEHLMEHTYSR